MSDIALLFPVLIFRICSLISLRRYPNASESFISSLSGDFPLPFGLLILIS